MNTYKTPGVFTEEIAKLPASVAQVATAIPAFIGYTQMTNRNGNVITPVRISSLQEYELLFGRTIPASLTVFIGEIRDNDNLVSRVVKPWLNHPVQHTMYYHMQLYFANGGGPCYVVSVGKTNNVLNNADFQAGLNVIRLYDEPTLLVIPEGVNLANAEVGGYRADITWSANTVYRYQFWEKEAQYRVESLSQYVDALSADVRLKQALADAATAALDPDEPTQEQLDAWTEATTMLISAQASLSNAQSMLDSANSSLTTAKNFVGEQIEELDLAKQGLAAALLTYQGADLNDLYTQALTQCADLKDRFLIADCYNNDPEMLRAGIGMNNLKYGAAYHPFLETSLNYLSDEDVTTVLYLIDGNVISNPTLNQLKVSSDPQANLLYNLAKEALATFTIPLNPSATIAGVYAAVDNSRGVWKAPANVSLNNVNGLTQAISEEEQSGLNVDPTAGKSVNAIRAFTGKGILVWGARTLAGNDNEWRYVSVRRFFNMVEESTKKATEAFVFEANDANTWVKVQSMVENYLTQLWRDGALQGAKTEDAFYVSVGLGKTMTAQDILEGRMYVEIGMAVVRPAEFIILRFSHKLAES